MRSTFRREATAVPLFAGLACLPLLACSGDGDDTGAPFAELARCPGYTAWDLWGKPLPSSSYEGSTVYVDQGAWPPWGACYASCTVEAAFIDDPSTVTRVYTYDDVGRWISQDLVADDGVPTDAPIARRDLTYDESGHIARMEEWYDADRDGSLETFDSLEISTYSADGLLLTRSWTGDPVAADEEPTESRYEYLDGGARPSRYDTYATNYSTGWVEAYSGYRELTWGTDGLTDAQSYVYDADEDGVSPGNSERYTWSDGLARTRTRFQGERTYTDGLTYDNEGRVVGATFTVQEGDGEPTTGQSEFFYDEDGRISSVPGGDGGGTVYTTVCP